ncbi:hypothetical protein ASD22_08970 [Rhodanobacter sp. Root480]|uniref:hypothetical protein n=1 Tax=Rhodanobacter sp. Root480 TaxID=1736542 RepID=UPI0006FD8895|nr:hypothetical protein [Rhodanobacter sp. Root480]KQX97395.1 hypothetical protein ASD22_08970 [Rhodanobacter sp. Root480]
MDSPLAARRAVAYRQRTRVEPRETGRRIVGIVGTMLVHVVFLLVFVLGPAYQVKLPPESQEKALRVRLIDAPEPPPPPPVRGTPPKEIGPRHQARVRPAATRPSVRHTSASTAAPSLARVSDAKVVPEPAVVSPPAPVRAPTPDKPAAPLPPISLPTPAPTPELQPIPLAAEPPSVTPPVVSMQPPVPPKFQPEAVRPPQLEGTQPMPPPASLALPPLPAQAPPPVSAPSIALDMKVPRSAEPPSVQPIRATVTAAPPVPDMQAVPLPAQPSPQVNLQATFTVPTPVVQREAPRIETPAVEVAEAQLDAVPQTALARPAVAPPEASAVKVQDTRKAMAAIERPVLARPQLSEQPAPEPAAEAKPAAVADAGAEAAPATKDNSAADTSAADTSEPTASAETSTAATSKADAGRDVSTAPDAIAQGSDTATPGEPAGVAKAAASDTGQPAPTQAQGSTKAATGKSRGVGEQGAEQAGAAQGEKQGELGDYVQLKPRGDTDVMSHRSSSITYKATSFDKYWAPKNESSIDTALRRAVEKTTIKHTFNLPQGIRVECSASPLLPIALLGCGNPDPPAKPLGQEVYRRLNLPSTAAGVPTVPAPAASAPKRAIVFTNDAECAAARVAGGPLPPGCESAFAPAVKPAAPARSSSSWVPASDQFIRQ